MSLDVATSGNHGTNLLGRVRSEYAYSGKQRTRPGSKPLARTTAASPGWKNQTVITNKDYSNDNALQATLNQRNWHGLTSTIGYTYGHAS